MNNKICTKCKKKKPVKSFYKNKKTGYYQSWCKECLAKNAREYRRDSKKHKDYMKKYQEKNADKRREYSKKYHKKYPNRCRDWCRENPEKVKGYSLKHKYGITLKQHKEMYLSQSGCCAICNTPISYDDIKTDHNHSNGKVRQLLCHTCNGFVGFVEKYLERLEPIKKYLEKHNARK